MANTYGGAPYGGEAYEGFTPDVELRGSIVGATVVTGSLTPNRGLAANIVESPDELLATFTTTAGAGNRFNYRVVRSTADIRTVTAIAFRSPSSAAPSFTLDAFHAEDDDGHTFDDDFNRADGAVGNGWTTPSAFNGTVFGVGSGTVYAPVIASNVLVGASGAASKRYGVIYRDLTWQPTKVSATISGAMTTDGESIYLCLGGQNVNGDGVYLAIERLSGFFSWRVVTMSGGTVSTEGTAIATASLSSSFSGSHTISIEKSPTTNDYIVKLDTTTIFTTTRGDLYVIQSGDVLEYDIRTDVSDAEIAIDLIFGTGATVLRSLGVDQYGLASHPAANLDAIAYRKWVSRSISLSAYVGLTILDWIIASERDQNGTYITSFRQIRITNGSGTTRRKLFMDDDPAPTSGTSSTGSSGTWTVQTIAKIDGRAARTDVTANLRHIVTALRATVTGDAVITGSLGAVLRGAIAGATVVAVDLSRRRPLAAAVSGTSAIAGTLSFAVKALFASVIGSGFVTSRLSGPVLVGTGTSNGTTSVVGDLQELEDLVANVTGTSAVTVTTIDRHMLRGGRSNGVGSVTGEMHQQFGMAVAINSATTVIAKLARAFLLSTGTANGVSVNSGNLTKAKPLATIVAGATSLTSDLTAHFFSPSAITGSTTVSSRLLALMRATIQGSTVVSVRPGSPYLNISMFGTGTANGATNVAVYMFVAPRDIIGEKIVGHTTVGSPVLNMVSRPNGMAAGSTSVTGSVKRAVGLFGATVVGFASVFANLRRGFTGDVRGLTAVQSTISLLLQALRGSSTAATTVAAEMHKLGGGNIHGATIVHNPVLTRHRGGYNGTAVGATTIRSVIVDLAGRVSVSPVGFVDLKVRPAGDLGDNLIAGSTAVTAAMLAILRRQIRLKLYATLQRQRSTSVPLYVEKVDVAPSAAYSPFTDLVPLERQSALYV